MMLVTAPERADQCPAERAGHRKPRCSLGCSALTPIIPQSRWPSLQQGQRSPSQVFACLPGSLLVYWGQPACAEQSPELSTAEDLLQYLPLACFVQLLVGPLTMDVKPPGAMSFHPCCCAAPGYSRASQASLRACNLHNTMLM